jgi:uncharacterized protein YqcC (DUF446 family)
MPLKPRDLIIDNWEREGIVVERAKRPAAGWLSDQTDRRVLALPTDTVWWSVLDVRGGGVLVPEPLAQFIREATIDDAMRAVEHANEHALRTIAQLFPETVERALKHRSSALAQKLNEIEIEMKRIGYWQANPPDLQAQAARGEFRSYLDAPSFEMWLQALFLPNARHSLETGTLPPDSEVGVIAMRQYDYHSIIPEAHGLVKLLHEFDDLVRRHKT